MFCWRTPLRSSPSVQDLPWRALASRDCDSSLPSVWRNTSTPWTGTNSPDLYINSLFCSSLLCFAVFVFAATTFYIPLEVRCAVEGPAPDQIRPIFTTIGYASARSLLLWILRERKKCHELHRMKVKWRIGKRCTCSIRKRRSSSSSWPFAVLAVGFISMLGSRHATRSSVGDLSNGGHKSGSNRVYR